MFQRILNLKCSPRTLGPLSCLGRRLHTLLWRWWGNRMFARTPAPPVGWRWERLFLGPRARLYRSRESETCGFQIRFNTLFNSFHTRIKTFRMNWPTSVPKRTPLTCADGQGAGLHLVSHLADGFWARPDEHHACICTGLSEVGPLGEETIAGVYGINFIVLRGIKDAAISH